MTSALTRRGLVAAAPAAIVAAAVPALAASSHIDTELLALREPYDRTMAGMDAASPAHSRAEDAYLAAKRAQPEVDEQSLARATGFDRAERAWTRAVDANTDVILQITETRARTLEGLIFKARVADEDALNSDLMASIVTDLLAMGGSHA